MLPCTLHCHVTFSHCHLAWALLLALVLSFSRCCLTGCHIFDVAKALTGRLSIVDCREARRVPSICLEAGIIDNFASMLLNVYMEL